MADCKPIPPGSQCDRIMQYLQEHGTITQLDCTMMHPPILRLASRISDLRNKHGILIIPDREASYDENGKERAHWASYHLPTIEELASNEET